MRLRGLIVVGMLALASAACQAPAAAPRVAQAPTTLDAEAIFQRVIAIRGLSPTAPITVEHLDDRAFAAKQSESDNASPEDIALSSYRDRTIFLRRAHERDPGAISQLVALFEGMVTEDHFHFLAESRDPADADGNATRRALRGADQALTLIGYQGLEDGTPASWEIAIRGSAKSALNDSKDTPPMEATDLNGIVVAREFLGALYRTGGFRLIDRFFATKPHETRALLDAQDYLDGLERIAPPRTTLPSTTRVVHTPVNAFFLMTLLMRSGADEASARALARAMRGGDMQATTLPQRTDDVMSFWVLSFATADDAKNASKYVTDPDKPDDSAAGASTPDPNELVSKVAVAGNVVALTFDVPRATSDALLREATTTAASPAKRDPRPFGELTIAPVPQLADERVQTTHDGDTFIVPAMRFVAKAPFTFEPVVDKELPDVVAMFRGDGAFAGVLYSSTKGDLAASSLEKTPAALGRRLALDESTIQRPPQPWQRLDGRFEKARLVLLQRAICGGRSHALVELIAVHEKDVPFLVSWALALDFSAVEGSDYCRWVQDQTKELRFP